MNKTKAVFSSALLCSGLFLAACDPTVSEPGPINYVARLIYPAGTQGCQSAVGSQTISWEQCHSFLHSMNSDGTPILSGAPTGSGFRPIRAFVNLRYLKYNLSGAPVVCDERTIQTDMEGRIRVPLNACGGSGNRAVVGRVYLQYAIQNADHTRRGFVRTLWEHERALDVFPLTGDDVVQDGHGFRVRNEDGTSTPYAVPELVFKTELGGAESVGTVAAPAIINGGTKLFLNSPESGADEFNYMKQVLSAHNSMIELHERLRANFATAGRENEYFDKVFFSDGRYASLNHYNIWLNANWAFGFKGGIALYRPDLAVFNEDGDENGHPDGASAWGVSRLLSHLDTLSHEFGHSVHAGLAGASFRADARFADPMKNLAGSDYNWGHGGNQLQEMGFAMTEGMANTFGQYLLNQCNGAVPSRRPISNNDTWNANMWSGDTSCDTNDFNACSAHHIRYHLVSRGTTSGDATYSQRMTRLQALTALGRTGGHLSNVTSNNEFRYGEFGCDLVDSDAEVGHAFPTRNSTYIPSFTYSVNRIFNGNNDTIVPARFASTLNAESVQITFPQLFDAVGTFCSTCSSLNGDLFSDDYGVTRLKASTSSQLSPQSLGAYIVGQGWTTDAQIRNLLQSNFMENNY